MRLPKKILLAGLVSATTLSGCSINIQRDAMDEQAQSIESSNEAQSSHEGIAKPLDVSGQSIRNQAVENNHYAYYFQKTVYESYQAILSHVTPMSDSLDEIFNFEQLLYQGRMLPPVIEEAEDYLGIQNERSLVKTQRQWKIIKDARVVASIPVWQDYLYEGVKVQPNRLNKKLLPVNSSEERSAELGIERGISEGRDYAVSLFKTNLSRLRKDFVGMLTYKRLEIQEIVEAPVLAVSDEPFIYGKGNKEISVGTQRYLITQDSRFNKYQNWKPIVSGGQTINERDQVFSPDSYK